MYKEEDYEIEGQGCKDGINPFFGEFFQVFYFKPVSYQNTGTEKDAFKKAIRQSLTNKYVFIEFVSLTITLYLNEKKFLETPKYGDLDNYAKLIIDCLKGKDGIMIDDCQIQRLEISWIDTPNDEYFEIKIQSRPDEFMQKTLILYEMPDSLFYPLSQFCWTKEGVKKSPIEHVYFVLDALNKMTSKVKEVRHEFRKSGLTELSAYYQSNIIKPSLLGFHKSRVIDSGFEIFNKSTWQSKFLELDIDEKFRFPELP